MVRVVRVGLRYGGSTATGCRQTTLRLFNRTFLYFTWNSAGNPVNRYGMTFLDGAGTVLETPETIAANARAIRLGGAHGGSSSSDAGEKLYDYLLRVFASQEVRFQVEPRRKRPTTRHETVKFLERTAVFGHSDGLGVALRPAGGMWRGKSKAST